jgi:hypothetical protein
MLLSLKTGIPDAPLNLHYDSRQVTGPDRSGQRAAQQSCFSGEAHVRP